MKNTSTPARFELFFTLVAFIFFGAVANAHESADTETSAALIRHMLSSPDHVLILLIAVGAALWGLYYKFTRQHNEHAASSEHDKQRSE